MEQGESKVTLLIAIAVRLYREGLAAALTASEHFKVVAMEGDSTRALAAAIEFKPAIAIIDVSFPGALKLMNAMRTIEWDGRVIAFAVGDQATSCIAAYAAAGACGFVTTNDSLESLIEVIRRTAAGELFCSSSMAPQFLKAFMPADATPPAKILEPGFGLTARELQILSLVREGCSNKQIAIKLGISPATVKNHVHQLLQKLNVSTRGRAAVVSGLGLRQTLGS